MKIYISFLFILAGASFSFAASFVVTTNGDTHDASTADGVCRDADGRCTLRAAIEQSNATASDDTITFVSPTSTIVLTLNSELAVTNGALRITADTLVAVERSYATGTPDFRVFKIGSSSRVTMTNLKIGNGRLSTVEMVGGGIRNDGDLTLVGSTVSNNFLGIENTAVTGMVPMGGGIFNTGTLALVNSVVENNRVSHINAIGGGIASIAGASLSLANSIVRTNTAVAQSGTSSPGSAVGAGINNAAPARSATARSAAITLRDAASAASA